MNTSTEIETTEDLPPGVDVLRTFHRDLGAYIAIEDELPGLLPVTAETRRGHQSLARRMKELGVEPLGFDDDERIDFISRVFDMAMRTGGWDAVLERYRNEMEASNV